MSQYEYYEFQAVDRRLNVRDMQELRACSSRAQITPTSFTNEYHLGSFKGDDAVQHLKDLRDLASRGASQPDFRSRVEAIRSAHPAKRGLLDRLQRKGL